jgi:hypothetical protein
MRLQMPEPVPRPGPIPVEDPPPNDEPSEIPPAGDPPSPEPEPVRLSRRPDCWTLPGVGRRGWRAGAAA